MTENEVIERLLCMCLFMEINDRQNESKFLEDDHIANKIAIQALEEIQQYRAIGTVEEVRMLKDYKELYDVYNLIGTIEEFRNLKYKKNVPPIATITINKEDIQRMVDEKVAQIELDIQEIRAKVIDEFAERIALEISESIIWGMLPTDCKDGVSDEIVDYVIDTSKKIAEQLKGGAV